MDLKVSKTPKTNSDLKNSNIKGVFLAIQSMGPILRKNLQEKTGLSWGSISFNINTLCEMKLIAETEYEGTSVGRKPHSFDINPYDNYLIGIDIQKSMLRAVAADLKGRTAFCHSVPLAYTDKISVLEDIYLLIDRVLREINGKKVICIGIAVQGIVSKNNAVSKYFPEFSDWENVDLKRLVEERFGLLCFIFHDPDAIMCAEKLFLNARNPSLRNVALVRLDNGVGMSIMINREIFTSSTGKSGEIGHINVEKDGLECICGDRGCLEAYVTSGSIIKRFLSAVRQGESTSVRISDITAVNINTLATAAKSGDPLCRRLFVEMGDYLGIALSSYINVFNPQLIIIQGEFTKYRYVYESYMRASIEKHVWYANETDIVFAEYDQFVAAMGAALASFEKTLNETSDFEQVFSRKNPAGFIA